MCSCPSIEYLPGEWERTREYFFPSELQRAGDQIIAALGTLPDGISRDLCCSSDGGIEIGTASTVDIIYADQGQFIELGIRM
jgi:hypothetical protein